jgi:large conductance mechanosensitive channel
VTTTIRLPKPPGWVHEFKAFIMRGNVVDLAVGIIVGAAFTAIVNSLVKDIFNPLLGVAIGGIDFSNLFIALNGQHYPTLEAAQKAGAPTLNVGVFINTVIQFVIIAFAVFWVVKAVSKLIAKHKEAGQLPLTKSEELLTQIRDLLAEEHAKNSGPAIPAA